MTAPAIAHLRTMGLRTGQPAARSHPAVTASNGHRVTDGVIQGGTTVKRTIAEQSVAPPPGRDSTIPPPVARPALEPVRTRRRPLLVGLGIALTALGGLGAVWLASTPGPAR